MAGNSPNVSHLFTGSVKALAVVLVDSILAHNYSLRDGLQDWDEVLSKDIRKSPASLHTPHLEAIRVLTESFERALQPLCTALNPQEWDKEDEGDGDAAKEAAAAARSSERALVAADAGAEVAAHDGGGGRAGNAGQRDSTSSNPVASQASRGAGDDQTSVTIASSSSLPPPVRKGTRVAALATHPSFKSGSMRSVVSAQMDNAPSGDGSSGAARVSLKQFFRRQASEFMELSQDLQSMVGGDRGGFTRAGNISSIACVYAVFVCRRVIRESGRCSTSFGSARRGRGWLGASSTSAHRAARRTLLPHLQ